MKAEQHFSPDYATARERFREAATRAGAALHAVALSSQGPAGEALFIDLAWLGSPRPQRALLHIAGVHGVEAFTGSAAQLALLSKLPLLPADDAIVLVHVLNPYGMAWLRRTNENNVDLNRNFLLNGDSWSGAHELYRALDPLLNPPSPPAADGFAVRAAAIALRHGYHRVKQAIAQGQYEFPRGLFYGGKALEAGPRLFTQWLSSHVSGVSYLFAVDLHTGLGRHGTDTVLPELHVNTSSLTDLARVLGRPLVDARGPSVAYTVRGGLGGALPRVLPGTRIDFILQEIGTEPPLKVIHALREENRWHFFGDGSIVHPAKQRLREALCPSSVTWRRRAVAKALEVVHAAARWTFR